MSVNWGDLYTPDFYESQGNGKMSGKKERKTKKCGQMYNVCVEVCVDGIASFHFGTVYNVLGYF